MVGPVFDQHTYKEKVALIQGYVEKQVAKMDLSQQKQQEVINFFEVAGNASEPEGVTAVFAILDVERKRSYSYRYIKVGAVIRDVVRRQFPETQK